MAELPVARESRLAESERVATSTGEDSTEIGHMRR